MKHSITLGCKVIGITNKKFKEAFEMLKENDDVILDLDGINHQAIVSNSLFQPFGKLSKGDVVKCFEAIAKLNEIEHSEIYTWEINYTAYIYDLEYDPHKCNVSIVLTSSQSKNKFQKKYLLEQGLQDDFLENASEDWDFDWDNWHTNYKESSIVSFSVKGVTFKNNDGIERQSLLESMDTYGKIKLIPELENEFDSNAIAVIGKFGTVGYVPKEMQREVSLLLESDNLLIKGTVKKNEYDIYFMIVDIMILEKENSMDKCIIFFETWSEVPDEHHKYLMNLTKKSIFFFPPAKEDEKIEDTANIKKCELLHKGNVIETTHANGHNTYLYEEDEVETAFTDMCSKNEINAEIEEDFSIVIHYSDENTPKDIIKICGRVWPMGGDETNVGCAGAAFFFYFYISLCMHAHHKGAQGDDKIISDTRACPFCAETIKKAAILCKHCKSNIEPIDK